MFTLAWAGWLLPFVGGKSVAKFKTTKLSYFIGWQGLWSISFFFVRFLQNEAQMCRIQSKAAHAHMYSLTLLTTILGQILSSYFHIYHCSMPSRFLKTAAKRFVLSSYTSQDRPPLLECSLSLSSAAQVSGKAHEDCGHTIVITIVHWHFPWWQSCEWGN